MTGLVVDIKLQKCLTQGVRRVFYRPDGRGASSSTPSVALSSFLFLLYAAHSNVACSILSSLTAAAPLARAHVPPLGSPAPRPPRLLVSALSTPRRLVSYPSLSPSIPHLAMTSVCLYATRVWATAAASGKESMPPSLPALSPSLSHLHTSRDDDGSMAAMR